MSSEALPLIWVNVGTLGDNDIPSWLHGMSSHRREATADRRSFDDDSLDIYILLLW